MWAGPLASIPTGWMACDGSELSRADYADLFALIGESYGPGDGATTFELPDFRDRSPVGASLDLLDAAHTTVTGAATRIGGAATHVLTIAELPAHDHDISHTHSVGSVSGVGLAGGLATGLGISGSTSTSNASPMISGSAGGGQPHNNMPPYFAVTYMIYVGE